MKVIRYPQGHAAEQSDGTVRRIVGDLFGDWRVTEDCIEAQKVLAPVVPVAIFAIGLNYRQHAIETKAPLPEFPVLFMKNVAAVQNPGDPIILPRHLRSDEVDYECELAVIIGRRAKNVSRADALHYVFGYTCANDVSARDWQKRRSGGQWCRAKSFDTFCPLGPRIVTSDEIPNPNALAIRTLLNGEVLQESSTGDMIFDVPSLIEFLSGSTTLLPGTVILTGTPSGVGMARQPPRWLQPGDRVTVEIEQIGALTNPVTVENLLSLNFC